MQNLEFLSSPQTNHLSESSNTNYQKLREIKLFEGISDDKLRQMAPEFQERKYEKGRFPFDADDTNARFYFLKQGFLKVYQVHPETGREFTIFLLKEGDIFDIFTLMDNEVHDVETEVLEDLTVLSVNLETIRNLITTEPTLLKAFMPHLGKRLRLLEESAINFAIADTSVRLARIILTNYQENIHLSHDEIAKLIGSTRAVVNRHLQEIKNLGVIDIKRKRILIQKHDQLQKLAQVLN